MNLALPTLVFLVFLVPGFLFRRLYFSGEFSEQYFKENFVSLIFPTLLTSIVIHLLSYILLSPFFKPDTSTIGTFLSGDNNNKDISLAIQNVLSNYKSILLYFIIASFIGGFSGWLTKLIIRNYKLDRKYKILRFQNEWHYLFSGELLDFPNVPGRTGNIDLAYVDTLISTNEGTVLYSGLLDDYVLSSSNGIDRIYLKNVKRRFLKDDLQLNTEPEKDRYYFMPGDFFVIPFNKIINLHISYYKIELEPEIT